MPRQSLLLHQGENTQGERDTEDEFFLHAPTHIVMFKFWPDCVKSNLQLTPLLPQVIIFQTELKNVNLLNHRNTPGTRRVSETWKMRFYIDQLRYLHSNFGLTVSSQTVNQPLCCHKL